jgi:post-segregation antitoxin (ccd killing protein)
MTVLIYTRNGKEVGYRHTSVTIPNELYQEAKNKGVSLSAVLTRALESGEHAKQ